MSCRTGAHHCVAKSTTAFVESGRFTIQVSVELKQRIQ
jgi:hypothetical protein